MTSDTVAYLILVLHDQCRDLMELRDCLPIVCGWVPVINGNFMHCLLGIAALEIRGTRGGVRNAPRVRRPEMMVR